MLIRYGYVVLMAAADDGNGGGGGTPAAPTPPTPPMPPTPPAPIVAPVAPAAPDAPADLKKLLENSALFKDRLEAERSAATRALLKDLGVKDPDEVKSVLKAHREAEEARKTEAQKAAEKIAALEPAAKRAETLEETIRSYLAAEEKQIPDEKKGLLELAPPVEQPELRLAWISKAKTAGLFATAAAPATPAAPTAPTPPAPTPLPANTRAGGAPPTPTPGNEQKHPRDMTPDEFK
jgi:hypothetical protein